MNKTVGEELKCYNNTKAAAFSAFREGKLDETLDYIHAASSIAWKHHIGLWYDDELENLLFEIGNILRDDIIPIEEGKKKNIKRNIYIATGMTDVGGNPEVLKQWSKLLKSNFDEQILYITHSYASFIPIKYSEEFFSDTEMKVKELSFRDSNVKRIKDLINLLNDNNPDSLFLFIEPSDVVAIPAIYALNKKPKVILFNHADQSFWLGRKIMDYLIEFREEGARYSRNYRHINNSHVIPLPTDIKPKKIKIKKWNIKEDATVSLSIGSFQKVLGDDEINYFEVILRLLERFPNHYHIFITNPPSNDILERYLPNDPIFNERFIIDGPFPDLSPYYGMADFLIETFPISGGMVRLEAMACKLPIVTFYNKKFPLFSNHSKLPQNYTFEGSTVEEILDCSSKLIKNPKLREKEGKNLYKYYLKELSLEKIHEMLCKIIKGNYSPSIIENKEFNYDYDMEYARIYISNDDFESYKPLLLQSILKESSFSLSKRMKFYLKSLNNNEFKSKKLMLMYALFSIIGWKGCFIIDRYLSS